MNSVSASITPSSTSTAPNVSVNRKKRYYRAHNKRGKKQAEATTATSKPDLSEVPWPPNANAAVRFPKRVPLASATGPAVQFGTLQHNTPQQQQQQSPQPQQPVVYRHSPNGYYKHQGNQPYNPHQMNMPPMMYQMGYPMVGSMPQQMPMHGWIPAPAQQFGGAPMSQPDNYPYYYPGSMSGASMPPSMHGASTNSVPGPMYPAAPQSNVPSAEANGQQPSVVTAQPMLEHQGKRLDVTAESFVPGRLAEHNASSEAKNPANAASNAGPVASSSSDSAGRPVDPMAPVLANNHPLFKLPVKRVIKIVNPNADTTESTEKDMELESSESKNEEQTPKTYAAVVEEQKQEAVELAEEAPVANEPAEAQENADVAAEPVPASVEPATDVSEDIKNDGEEAARQPAEAAVGNCEDTKNDGEEAAQQPVEAAVGNCEDTKNDGDEIAAAPTEPKETETSPSDEAYGKSQEPQLMSQSSSRQVTFSKDEEEPSRRVLQADEVVELHSGSDNAPSIVDDILRFPPGFLKQFIGLCKPPAEFYPERINMNRTSSSSERGSRMNRSVSGLGHQRDPTASMSEFGGMGKFRRSRTDESLGSSKEQLGQSTLLDAREGMGGRFGSRSSFDRRNDRGAERTSRRGRGHGQGGSRHGPGRDHAVSAVPLLQPQDVRPLEKSATRFVPRALRADKDAVEDEMDEKVFRRRILTILNKLTPDNCEIVSEELIAWGEKSAQETDGRILRSLVELLVDKAADENKWMGMYVNIFLKLIHRISSNVQDHSVRSKATGGYLSGGHLVRKYLLHKCQGDFEQGWKVEMPEAEHTDEYYNAVMVKRRGLGLAELIGRLYLLDVLTVDIMKSCVRRLLANVETPAEEVLQSMMELLSIIGKKMDVPEHKEEMNLYFNRIKRMTGNAFLSPRIRLLLKNLVELREKRWRVRLPDETPMTIAEFHEDLERKRQAKNAAHSFAGHPRASGERRNGRDSLSNSSSRRGESVQSAGDLTRFGDLSRSKQRPTSQGPAKNPFSAFASGSRGWHNGAKNDEPAMPKMKGEEEPRFQTLSARRTSSHSSRASGAATPDAIGTQNMFATLMGADEVFGQAPDAMGADKVSEQAPGAVQLDAGEIQARVKKALDAYIEDQSELSLIGAFKKLGAANSQRAAFQTIDSIMDRRPDHAELSINGVSLLATSSVLAKDTLIAALAEYSGQLEDIALDVPSAFKFFGMLMAAARVPAARVSEALGELATKVDSPRPPAMGVVFAYLRHMVKMDGEEPTRAGIEDAGFDVKQFMCPDRRGDGDVKRALEFQDLLGLFPKYA